MAESITPDIRSLAQLLEDTLTQDPRDPQRIIDVIRECRHIGIDVLPFDINRSAFSCAIEDEQAIRAGFSLFVPAKAGYLKAILTERTSGGAFTSFQDFCERLDMNNVPHEFLTQAIRIGGFDSIETSRSNLLQGHLAITQQVRSAKEQEATGQFSLFAQPAIGSAPPITLPRVEEWTKEERIAQEEAALGFSFEECLLDVELEDEDDEIPQEEEEELSGAKSDAAVEEAPVDESVSEAEHEKFLDQETAVESATVQEAGPVLQEQAENSKAHVYSSTIDHQDAPTPNFDDPPLPQCELTADDYEAAFPEGIHVHAPVNRREASTNSVDVDKKESLETPDTAEDTPIPEERLEEEEGEAENAGIATVEDTGEDNSHPQLVIQLSTFAGTERALIRLERILRQYPGHIPVCFHCINLTNQKTVVPARKNFSIDASDACLAAIAAITGYHAIQLRNA